MDVKKLFVMTSVSLIFLTPMTYADISIQAPYSMKGDPCDEFVGTWNGDGKIHADFLGQTVHCHYSSRNGGDIEVRAGEGNNYQIHLQITKSPDSDKICPGDQDFTFAATCKAGNLQVKMPDVDLHGATSGRDARLSGVIYVPVGDSKILTTVDSLSLTKQ